MIINDRVYGKQEIKDKFILDLINSKPMQRLKEINQHGATYYVWPEKFDITRFEHSLGVYFLLRRLNASDEELVAGLLHDIAHTAFSHVVDFSFGTIAHNYHEKFFEKIIMGSEIPLILKTHNFDVKRILEEKNFPLMEKEIPGLCADRLDYFFRDMLMYGIITKKDSKYLLDNLVVKDKNIVMKDKKSALLIGKKYLQGSRGLWATINVVGQYNLLAQVMKSAVERNIITEEDFFKTDKELYDILMKDKESKDKILLLNPDVKYIEDPDNYDFFVKTKLRYVDPLFLEDNQLKRLSEEDSRYRQELDKLKEFISKGFYIKIKVFESFN
jgi:uncharacterized protein